MTYSLTTMQTDALRAMACLELAQYYAPFFEDGGVNPHYGSRAIAKAICEKWGLTISRNIGGYTGKLAELAEWAGYTPSRYPVETDEPLPSDIRCMADKRGGCGPKSVYPWDDLELNGSFVAHKKAANLCDNAGKARGRVFISRKTGTNSIRIWRIS